MTRRCPLLFAGIVEESPLLRAEGETGACRVVCFSPGDLTLARLGQSALERVVATWVEQTLELGTQPGIRYVQIFENRGEMMGASNPHPHGQIWASSNLPNETAKELATQTERFRSHGRTILIDYLALELEREVRIVCRNEHLRTGSVLGPSGRLKPWCFRAVRWLECRT